MRTRTRNCPCCAGGTSGQLIDCDGCPRPSTLNFTYTHAGTLGCGAYDDTVSGTLTFRTITLTWQDCAPCNPDEDLPCEDTCGTVCDVGGGFVHDGFVQTDNFCYCHWTSQVEGYVSEPVTVTDASCGEETVRFILVCSGAGVWTLLWYYGAIDNNFCDHDPFLDQQQCAPLSAPCNPLSCTFSFADPRGAGSSTFEVTQPV